VVVIGGSAGIGLEVARRARAEGADVILTGRDPERLQHAASELGALSSAAFDATDPACLDRFFQELPKPIDHVMVTAGQPQYGRLADMDYAQTRQALDEHLMLTLEVARNAAGKVRPGGRCCSWAAPAVAVPASTSRSRRRSRSRCPLS
jgi:NADP-dependent 3-hydroxy acid dehydrogenase YdfG